MGSRLQSHKNKVYRNQIIFFVVILISFVIFFFTVGFKLLLGTSVFVNQIFNKENDKNTANIDDFYGLLTIDDIPSATNSARFFVSGSTENFYRLIFYLNGEVVNETLIKNNAFHEELGDLVKGKNELFIIAQTKDKKHRKKSSTYELVFNNEKPKLEITEPKDQQKVTKDEIVISGITTTEASIQLNNLPVVVDTQGNFRTSLRLNNGENKIKVTATDDYGNIEEKSLTVIYQKEE